MLSSLLSGFVEGQHCVCKREPSSRKNGCLIWRLTRSKVIGSDHSRHEWFAIGVVLEAEKTNPKSPNSVVVVVILVVEAVEVTVGMAVVLVLVLMLVVVVVKAAGVPHAAAERLKKSEMSIQSGKHLS